MTKEGGAGTADAFDIERTFSMELWNRGDLYEEIWQQPLVKLAAKHGISAVMLGKVCRKLQIPLPGRGYWAKLQAGQTIKKSPLPPAKNLPVVQRLKSTVAGRNPVNEAEPRPEPNDEMFQQIRAIESRLQTIDMHSLPRHKLAIAAAKVLEKAKVDERGCLVVPWNRQCIAVHVSKPSLDRALNLMSAIIRCLENEGFSLATERERGNTIAQIFGKPVAFSISEKHTVVSRQVIQESPNWMRTEVKYQPSGDLEFRIGDRYSSWRRKDTKRQKLEELLPTVVVALLSNAREQVLHEIRLREEEVERHRKWLELQELRKQIEQEEKKLAGLDYWVTSWARVRQYREFIAELERVWIAKEQDVSPEAERGKRLLWMRQQADRLDPFIEGPPSVLDRKTEIPRW